MNRLKPIFILLVVVLTTSCASVKIPEQVAKGVQTQEAEIKEVKDLYFESLTSQLNIIKEYQLMLVDIYEEKYRMNLSNRLSVNGKKTILASASGNKSKDFLKIATLEKLDDFFDNKRDSIRNDIADKMAQVKILEKKFDNIGLINSALNDYLKQAKVVPFEDEFIRSLVREMDRKENSSINVGTVSMPGDFIEELEAVEKN